MAEGGREWSESFCVYFSGQAENKVYLKTARNSTERRQETSEGKQSLARQPGSLKAGQDKLHRTFINFQDSLVRSRH